MTLRGGFKLATVGTSPAVVLSADPSRTSLLLQAPVGSQAGLSGTDGASVFAKGVVNNVDNQVLASYTAPVGVSAFCPMVVVRTTTGAAPAVICWIARGANSMQLTGDISQGDPNTINAWLESGDTISLIQFGSHTGGTTDNFISIQEYKGTPTFVNPTVALGFGMSASITQGMPLFAGAPPLLLEHHNFGAMIGLELWAVANVANTQLAILYGYESDDLYCE